MSLHVNASSILYTCIQLGLGGIENTAIQQNHCDYCHNIALNILL